MKAAGLLAAVVGLMAVIGMSGCVSQEEYRKCERHNQIQRERLESLEQERQDAALEAQRCREQLAMLLEKGGYSQEQLQALEAQLAAKTALIERLTQKMGETALPVELSSALSDWAAQVGEDVVTYDERTGIVRFKSDLLFDKGEATVAADVVDRLKQLAGILTSPAAEGFDALIVGHTDNSPIQRADTLAKHPTNWHLSAHRAIAVGQVLASAGLPETQIAVMGLGEYHPIAPNSDQPGRRGNPLNRRVEIYVVPAGQLRLTTSAQP